MVLGGLWHGASWNFVIWGSLQGVMLSVSRLTLAARDRMNDALGVPRWLRDGVRVVVTFHLVCLSWVFFRAATLDDALTIVSSLWSGWSVPFVDLDSMVNGALGVLVLLAVHAAQERRGEQVAPPPRRAMEWARVYALLFAIVLFGVESGSQFIYFQF